MAASFAYADNWLTGNGLQDTRTLAQNYSSVYSIPDTTWNRSPSVNLSVKHAATSHLTLSGNAYFRYIRADTTNGDINEDSFDQSLYNLSVGDIAANFRTSRPAISKHLRMLREVGLVATTRKGTARICALNAEPLRAVSDWIGDYEAYWCKTLQSLRRYVEDER